MPTGRQNAEALIDQAIASAMAVPGVVSSHQLAAALRSVRGAIAAMYAGDTADNPEPVVENPMAEAHERMIAAHGPEPEKTGAEPWPNNEEFAALPDPTPIQVDEPEPVVDDVLV